MKHLIIIIITVLLIVAGTIVWILNLQGIIVGSWSGIFGAIFTALGVIFALLQISPSSIQAVVMPTFGTHKLRTSLEISGLLSTIGKDKGAIIVYTKKHLRGSTVNLCRGFISINMKSEKAASVVERSLNAQTVFVAVFPLVEPGNHTIYSESGEFIAKVTVEAGILVEIDWR